jgi:hypothetical protein
MKSHHHLLISGILFLAVLILWPVLMAVSQPSGSLADQLHWVEENMTLNRLQFFFALLISPSIIYMMMAQIENSNKTGKISLRFGWIFLAVYASLNSISYASQIILVPRFLAAGLSEQASIWYFNSPFSIAYFLNQLGYFFWAIAALVLFVGLVRQKGLIRYISMVYLLSAVLSVLAFAGLVIENNTLNFLTFPSGLMLVVVGVLTVVWGSRLSREPKS